MKVVLALILFSLLATGCSDRTQHLDSRSAKAYFNVAGGPAKETLARAASGARVEIMFSLKDVDGVITNSVDGTYTLEEAFSIMLEDTNLALVETGRKGVYSVRRI